MCGRSTKALQSQWTAVNKAIAELEVLGDAPMTPTKPTPKKAAGKFYAQYSGSFGFLFFFN